MKEIKTYVCEVCGKEFTEKEACSIHESRHIYPMKMKSFVPCRIPFLAAGVENDMLYAHKLYMWMSNGRIGCYTLASVSDEMEGEDHGKE